MKEQIQHVFADKVTENANGLSQRLAKNPSQIVMIISSSGGAPLVPSSRLFAHRVVESVEHALGVRLTLHEFSGSDGNILAASIDPRDLEPAFAYADGNDYPDAA